MTSILIPLPWPKPPLSQNDRDERKRGGARKIATVKAEALTAIQTAHPRPIVGATITLHYRVPDRRRRDADNLGPTLKAVSDALVAAAVLPDDSWVSVPSATCRIHPPNADGPAMWLELADITDYDEEIEP